MQTPAMLFALLGSAALASCDPAPAIYGPRGDPISSQAPTSQSGGVSMAQAASENGESTFTLEPRPHRDQPNPSTPCVWDRHEGRYRVCLNIASGGQCSTYGAACTGGERTRATVAPTK
jgi:hypothetical protein